MKQGFIRMAAATPKVQVANPAYNRAVMETMIDEAWKHQAKVLVFPELSLTGYSGFCRIAMDVSE